MRRLRRRTLRDGERGSSSVELVIVLPVVLLLVFMVAAGGRLALSQLAVGAAASEAARAASLARTAGQAQSGAETAAYASLANQSIRCVDRTVRVDTSQFARAVGTQAEVTATVTCTVDLAGLNLPGIPSSKTITRTDSSPLDTYRER